LLMPLLDGRRAPAASAAGQGQFCMSFSWP
jgi:hypothetical protein